MLAIVMCLPPRAIFCHDELANSFNPALGRERCNVPCRVLAIALALSCGDGLAASRQAPEREQLGVLSVTLGCVSRMTRTVH